MTIARIRSVWTGPQIVGGGVTDLYFVTDVIQADAVAANVKTFWDSIIGNMADGNQVVVEPEVVFLNEATGAVVNFAQTPTLAPSVGGSSADPLPPATQALIRWQTAGIVNNRRVRGRTFLPAMTESVSTEGVPSGFLPAEVEDAILDLLGQGDGELVIWSRPVEGGRIGSLHVVTGGGLWDQFAVLRSRRD